MLVVIVASAAWLLGLVRLSLVAVQMLQIEEYEVRRFATWAWQPRWILPPACILAAFAATIAGEFAVAHTTFQSWSIDAGELFIGSVLFNAVWRRLPAKKVLVYTARVRRLLTTALVMAVIVVAFVDWLVSQHPEFIYVGAISFLLLPSCASLVSAAATTMMRPIEALVRRRYVKLATNKLRAIHPRTISIVGSYGKTSTKHITAALFQPYMQTLATPKSYNTLMGVTRTINENLTDQTSLFVVEMDAYESGEIEEISKLVRPQMVIVTAVGPQHLERFGTLEAIADALYEGVQSVEVGGPCIVFGGDTPTLALANRARADGRPVVTYSLDEDTGCDVTASDITTDDTATHFTFRWPSNSIEQKVSIPLLGLHNVLNVTAALIAIHLTSLPLNQAVDAAAILEPIQHRLQRIHGAGGVTIIDDSYNANPVGIHNGLDVLASIKGQAKILVTPGLVELGRIEIDENRRLGVHAASVCNRVILVGTKQTEPIYAGLHDEGFPADKIHRVESLSEVTQTLAQVTRHGDVVLFANDLPDVYLDLH